MLQRLGAAVRRERAARKLTRRELALRAHLSLRFLADLEGGRGNISITRLAGVARALEVPLSALVADLELEPADQPLARPLALIGLRGAGKSTIGARVAEALAVPFVELDARVEARAGLPLFQLFEIHGEAYYRRLEREVILEVLAESTQSSLVLAAGGGIVTDPKSWRLLASRARTVWLKATPEDHYQRVMDQGDLRPMQNRPAAMAELRALLSTRRARYADADLTVDTSTLGLEGSVTRILEWR